MAIINERIEMLENIARKKADFRQRFMADREQKQAQAATLAKSAQPIVEPIVMAIKKEKPLPAITLGDSELKALINQIPRNLTTNRKT